MRSEEDSQVEADMVAIGTFSISALNKGYIACVYFFTSCVKFEYLQFSAQYVILMSVGFSPTVSVPDFRSIGGYYAH
jgi:hypothetical protein